VNIKGKGNMEDTKIDIYIYIYINIYIYIYIWKVRNMEELNREKSRNRLNSNRSTACAIS